MENETKKVVNLDSRKKIIIISAIVLVVLVALLMLIKPKDTTPIDNNQPNNNTDVVEEGEDVIDPVVDTEEIKDKFREEVPADIVIPDQNTVLTEEEKKITAIPTVVTEAAPGVEAQFRSFDIKGENGVFTPSKIIARVGDTIHVNFSAIDKDYDIVFPSYNMKQTAKKGQTKILEFQAVSDGSFLYYCDICGGEKSSTKGNIIIAK